MIVVHNNCAWEHHELNKKNDKRRSQERKKNTEKSKVGKHTYIVTITKASVGIAWALIFPGSIVPEATNG